MLLCGVAFVGAALVVSGGGRVSSGIVRRRVEERRERNRGWRANFGVEIAARVQPLFPSAGDGGSPGTTLLKHPRNDPLILESKKLFRKVRLCHKFPILQDKCQCIKVTSENENDLHANQNSISS